MHLLQSLLDPRHERLRFYTALVLYASVVILGSIPGARHEVGNMASGLILHFATYSVIACLLFTGINASASGRALRTVLAISGMGALDEFVQSFLPYRTGAIADWGIDMAAGIFVAGALWSLSTKIPVLRAVRK